MYNMEETKSIMVVLNFICIGDNLKSIVALPNSYVEMISTALFVKKLLLLTITNLPQCNRLFRVCIYPYPYNILWYICHIIDFAVVLLIIWVCYDFFRRKYYLCWCNWLCRKAVVILLWLNKFWKMIAMVMGV